MLYQIRDRKVLVLKPLTGVIRLVIAVGCLLLNLSVLPLPLAAATRTVTTLADDGPGSLRQAVIIAGPGDTIHFAVSGMIVLTSGEVAIGRNLTILGPTDASVAVSGNNASRVFNVVGGTVNMANLTIKDGHVVGVSGSEGAAGQAARGGGISNQGSLTLTNCTVVGNSVIGGHGGDSVAVRGGPGGDGIGGGIWNQGALSLVNCTLTMNKAYGGNGGGVGLGGTGGAGSGGGIANSGSMILVHCTVSGNSSYGGPGGPGQVGGPGGDCRGGGIHSEQNLSAPFMRNTLIAGNSVAAGPGHLHIGRPGSRAPDGITAGPDVEGLVSSDGHNLIGQSDDSSGWIETDLRGSVQAPLDPLLSPLEDYGGPAPTMALAPSSAAVDAGDDSITGSPNFLSTDQRGLPRRNGSHVDIGAFEWQQCHSPRGLVNRWRAEANAADDIGTKHGDLLNNTTFSTGPVGQAFSFDGVDDRVVISGFLTKVPTTEITVEFWQNVSAAKIQSTFSQDGFTPGSVFNAHVPYADGVVYWDFGDIYAGGRLSYTPSVSILGSWQHFAFVASQTSNHMRIYRNGVLEASKPNMTPFVRTDGDWALGGAGGLSFAGAIDEFSIYDRALSVDEIAAIYNGGVGGECPEFLIESFTWSGSTAQLTWRSTAGKTYRVQFRAALTSATAWADLSGDIIATGVNTSFTDTALGSAPQGFYQVVEFPR